jgi:hypothetical protein
MSDDMRKLYAARQRQAFAAIGRPQRLDAGFARSFVARFLRAVRPFDVAGARKIRLGPYRDGGYVMLDPGRGGVAYSLGISTYSPWDMEMAERGFTVHQYDASIACTPTPHPNVVFHPYFIMDCEDMPDDARRLPQEILANDDWRNDDLILQMDVEGAEWEIFDAMDEATLNKFSQIIVEFHGLYFETDKLAVLEKLRATHTPVHVHYNNRGTMFHYIDEFVYQPYLLEISYARNGDNVFAPCNDHFPTPLDAPNVPDKPDVPIGFFDLLLEEFSSDA